jgi:hypothetical protein
MAMSKRETVWERTNVTNLLRNRQSGTYYARAKVNGKQKWRSLETKVFSVAKLKLPDTWAIAARAENESGHGNETHVGRFFGHLSPANRT